MKLFDCHCHFHLGPRGLVPLLQNVVPPRPTPSLSTVPRQQELPSASTSSRSDQNKFSFAGAAIMSTHPRDYPQVDACVSTLHERSYMAVPCYGIHPWFLHEVLHLNDEDRGTDGGKESNKDNDWLVELRGRLMANPHAIVGEIGLDGARWRVPKGDNAVNKSRDEIANNQDNTTAWKYQKRMLSCPMSLQQEAFEQQLIVATELHRPVSIHVVQAWGELLDSLSNVQEMMRQKYSSVDSLSYLKADGKYQSDRRQTKQQQKKKHQKQLLLPPKMFFHAFSGKAGLLPSLFAAIKKCNVPRDNVYFGFSPVSAGLDVFFSICSLCSIHDLILMRRQYQISTPRRLLP